MSNQLDQNDSGKVGARVVFKNCVFEGPLPNFNDPLVIFDGFLVVPRSRVANEPGLLASLLPRTTNGSGLELNGVIEAECVVPHSDGSHANRP